MSSAWRRRAAPGSGLDEGGHGLAEALVGHADHRGVGDGRVLLEHLLDLLGIDLLAAGVDAPGAPAEQRRRRRRRRPRPSRRGSSSARRRRRRRWPPTSPGPCSSRAACGPGAPRGPARPSPARRPGRRRRAPGCWVRGGTRAVGGGGRSAVVVALAMPMASDEPSESIMMSRGLWRRRPCLGLGAPHHARRHDHPQARDVPAVRLGVEGAEDRAWRTRRRRSTAT